MSFWINDLPAMFVDFGVDVTLGNGTSIRGLYESEYVPVGDVAVESFGPAVTVMSSDATAQEIALGDTVTIEESDFTVRSIRPDGTGVTVLRLELQ